MADLPRADFLELPVADVAAAQDFYKAAFGWEMTGFGPTYACTLTGDVDLGLQADPAERTRAPLIVIQVTDLEDAMDAVQAAGGVISKPVFSYPGGSRFHFRDLDGNELAAHKPKE